MRKAVLVLGLAALGACGDGGTEPRSDVAAYVRIVDEDGDPLRPDVVTWYYDPLTPRFDGEHPAACADRACTLWALPREADGAVYAAASWTRAVPGSTACFYSGYDGRAVAPSPSAPPTVVLRLNTHGERCE